MTKLLILSYCLLMMLCMSSCQKKEIKLEQLSQRIEEGTWNYNKSYDDFTLKKIVFENGEMTLSYDTNLDGKIDYNWPHRYYISRVLHNTYLYIQPTSKKYYSEWCRFELRNQLLYLFFKKGEVVFTIDRN